MTVGRIVLAAACIAVPFAVACGGNSGGGEPQPTPSPTVTSTGSGYPTPTPTGSSTTLPNPTGCPDPGICGPGMRWDYNQCSCEPNNAPPPFGCDGGIGMCPFGDVWDPTRCRCVPSAAGCPISANGVCPEGQSCVIGTCPDGTPESCYCDYNNVLTCQLCAPVPEAGPDAGGCFIPGYGFCPFLTSCWTGTCGNGISVSCYCLSSSQYECGTCDAGGLE
jgi:hypothetical protein